MAVMTALEPAGLFTRADFEKLPEFPGETRYRYELLDGAIIVSPSPGLAHQQAVLELAVLLREAAPSGLMVAVSPLDTYLPTGDVLEPDVLGFGASRRRSSSTTSCRVACRSSPSRSSRPVRAAATSATS